MVILVGTVWDFIKRNAVSVDCGDRIGSDREVWRRNLGAVALATLKKKWVKNKKKEDSVMECYI